MRNGMNIESNLVLKLFLALFRMAGKDFDGQNRSWRLKNGFVNGAKGALPHQGGEAMRRPFDLPATPNTSS